MKLLSSHLLVTVMLRGVCVCTHRFVCVWCDKGATGKTEPSRGEGDTAGFPSPTALVIPHALLHVETINGKIQTRQTEMTERHLNIKAWKKGCKNLNRIGSTPSLSSTRATGPSLRNTIWLTSGFISTESLVKSLNRALRSAEQQSGL